MNEPPSKTSTTRARAGILISACALLVTSCGGTGGADKPSVGDNTATDKAGANIVTAKGQLGLYLTDAEGKSLYIFGLDSATKSRCTGDCLTHWPPLSTVGPPSMAGHQMVGMLGTITRADGSKQVTYAGHPLYYSVKDSQAGDVLGQRSNEFGGNWWLVTPAGEPIKGNPEGASPTTS